MKLTDQTVATADEIQPESFAVPGIRERRRVNRVAGGNDPAVPVGGFNGGSVNNKNQQQ